MKKFLISILILIIILISLIFGLFFTKYGNNLIASYIENKVNSEQENVKLKVNNLDLSFKTLDFNASIDEHSFIDINGNFEIFKKRVDLKYDIKIEDLSYIKNLINYDLKGFFTTNGTFVGDEKNATINGVSNFAKADTNYKIDLKDFNIDSVNIDSKGINIEEFLTLLNKPIYSKGILDLNANLINIKSNSIDGDFIANISKATLNKDVINKEFNQTLTSNPTYNANIKSDFSNSIANLNLDLFSSLGDLKLFNTKLNLKDEKLISNYILDIKSLEKLESFIGKKLKGEFVASGKIDASKNEIKIDGASDILGSSTTFNSTILDNSLKSLNIQAKDAKLETLLKILDEPVYAVGNYDINANLKNLNLDFKNIKLINEVINTVFNQELKENIILNAFVNSKLEETGAISNIDIDSNIAKLNIKNLDFNYKEKTLDGNYIFNSSNLEKLKDFTKATLKGDIEILGNIKGSVENLGIDGKSKVVGGDLDFIFKNSNLNATLKNANMKKALYMLNQKENFDSNIDLNLDYNTQTKKGSLNGEFLNGHFIANDFTKAILQFTKLDLTKEIYEKSIFTSKIDNKILNANLSMNSKNSNLESQNAILDFEKNSIDALINAKIKKDNFTAKLSGDMKNPKVSVDLKDLIEKNIDKIEEKLNKVLGKEKDNKDTKELLKNLKKLF